MWITLKQRKAETNSDGRAQASQDHYPTTDLSVLRLSLLFSWSSVPLRYQLRQNTVWNPKEMTNRPIGVLSPMSLLVSVFQVARDIHNQDSIRALGPTSPQIFKMGFPPIAPVGQFARVVFVNSQSLLVKSIELAANKEEDPVCLSFRGCPEPSNPIGCAFGLGFNCFFLYERRMTIS